MKNIAGLALCLTALVAAKPATAQELGLQVEGAVAFGLDQPQIDRFSPGGYLAFRPGVSLGRALSVQWSYAVLATPAGGDFDEAGAAHFLTTGLRLRPFAALQPDAEQLDGLWLDGNLGYVRTGELDRFGFDVGLGYGLQVSDWLTVGPALRYTHVVQPDDLPNFDPNDAQHLTAGLNFSFGSGHEQPVAVADAEPPVCPACEESVCPEAPDCVAAPACPDSDSDGVCDSVDRCPTQGGSVNTAGCPIDPCTGAPLMMLVQFSQDSVSLPMPTEDDPSTMDPVLDAVARAIGKDPSCRVCIVGFASQEGAPGYNLDLSNRRASAVQAYMTARGLTKSKIPVTGMGEKCPVVPATTDLLNRRVEFRRLQDGESCPTDCAR